MMFDRVSMQEGKKAPHEQPVSHICIGMMSAILLGFFVHYFNYSANNNLLPCYANPDTTTVLPHAAEGYINVTQQWRTLMLVGIVWSSFHLFGVLLVMIKPLVKVGLGISCLSSCTYFAWLISATIFRWNETGEVCSGKYLDVSAKETESLNYLISEGLFMRNLTLSLWGIPACMISLACVCTFINCIFCHKKE